LAEDLQALGMATQLEYSEYPDKPDHSQDGERSGLASRFTLFVGNYRRQRDEIRYNSKKVDYIHNTLQERQLQWTRYKPKIDTNFKKTL